MFAPTYHYHEAMQLFHGSIARDVMGTRFDIVIPTNNEQVVNKLWANIVSLLSGLDKMLNRFDPQSELSVLNDTAHKAPIKLSPELWQIIQLCADYHQRTLGYFDVTLNDFSKVYLNDRERTISFLDDTTLDLGGFAKGYAMTKIEKELNKCNLHDAFIDFGNSSITALGKHPHGNCWKVSIGDPFDNGKLLQEFELRNASLSTSGNTNTYSRHIRNPFTKQYTDEQKLICVIAPNALDAEVLTTTLMIAPAEKKEKILANFTVEKTVEFDL